MSTCKYCGRESSSDHICNEMPIYLQNGFRAINRMYIDEPRKYRVRMRINVVSAISFGCAEIAAYFYFASILWGTVFAIVAAYFCIDGWMRQKPPGGVVIHP